MTKRVAISQSNYIPWKGYFDIINRVDVFVLYDTVQYTRRDWRNRNKIKTPRGTEWLTIPVDVKGKYEQAINETRVSDPSWSEKHFKSIEQHYRKAPFYDQYHDTLRGLYAQVHGEPMLSQINQHFISAINQMLGITTELRRASEFSVTGDKTARLVSICTGLNATHYLSGPAAQAYMDESLFEAESITVEYMDYSGYREYPQLYPPFEHGVSVIDLLMNTGGDALAYIESRAT